MPGHYRSLVLVSPDPNSDPSDLYLRWFGHLTIADLWKAQDHPTLLTRCGFTVHCWQGLDRDSFDPFAQKRLAGVGIVEDPDGLWRVWANDPLALANDEREFYWHQPVNRARILHRTLERSPAGAHSTLDDLVQDLAAHELPVPVDDEWVTGVALRLAMSLLAPDAQEAHQTLMALGQPHAFEGLSALDRWYVEHPEVSQDLYFAPGSRSHSS